MDEKITLDMLTHNGVSIKKQNYILNKGVEYPVGQIKREAYVNNAHDKERLKSDISEPYLSVILLMWDNNSTV